MQLLLRQSRLGRVERPQELGVSRRRAPAAAAHLAGLTRAVRRRRLRLVGYGRGRGAHFGKDGGGVGEGGAPGGQAEPRKEAPRGLARLLMLLLELLELLLVLDLLLMLELPL